MADMYQLENNPQGAAIQWLFEMELAGNPALLNSIVMNIIASTKGIKDLQIVVDERGKKILIYWEPTKYYGKFFKDKIAAQIAEMIDQVLPNFQKRVTSDRNLLDRAVKIMKNPQY
jgi:hypothetical protein